MGGGYFNTELLSIISKLRDIVGAVFSAIIAECIIRKIFNSRKTLLAPKIVKLFDKSYYMNVYFVYLMDVLMLIAFMAIRVINLYFLNLIKYFEQNANKAYLAKHGNEYFISFNIAPIMIFIEIAIFMLVIHFLHDNCNYALKVVAFFETVCVIMITCTMNYKLIYYIWVEIIINFYIYMSFCNSAKYKNYLSLCRQGTHAIAIMMTDIVKWVLVIPSTYLLFDSNNIIGFICIWIWIIMSTIQFIYVDTKEDTYSIDKKIEMYDGNIISIKGAIYSYNDVLVCEGNVEDYLFMKKDVKAIYYCEHDFIGNKITKRFGLKPKLERITNVGNTDWIKYRTYKGSYYAVRIMPYNQEK